MTLHKADEDHLERFGELIMWLVIARDPLPDAPYWPGRRVLAAADAVAWPAAWIVAVSHLPKPVGVVGPFLVAVTLLCAINRLHRAIWANERYLFTTWLFGRVIAALLLIGAIMKVMLAA